MPRTWCKIFLGNGTSTKDDAIDIKKAFVAKHQDTVVEGHDLAEKKKNAKQIAADFMTEYTLNKASNTST